MTIVKLTHDEIKKNLRCERNIFKTSEDCQSNNITELTYYPKNENMVKYMYNIIPHEYGNDIKFSISDKFISGYSVLEIPIAEHTNFWLKFDTEEEAFYFKLLCC